MDKEQLNQLKEEARSLGIEFSANIGAEKLQAKLDEYYESQESSGEEIAQAVKTVEEQSKEMPVVVSKPSVDGKKPAAQLARELYEEASTPVIVTIIDNDQRVNNQTTTCKANWTNMYYDMGTQIFPLNTPIEIPKGFIDVLKEVKIPHHVRDPKTGLAITSFRSRYSISYENMK
jgi:hypothetical protein